MRAAAVVLALLLVPAASAQEAWQREALGVPDHLDGAGVVVAVMDSGIQHDHPDLAQAMWANDGEVPNNNLDDDQNGYVDDVRGWDFCNDQPVRTRPVLGHGTSVAGTVAGRGTHALGVAPGATVMDLQVFCDNGGWPAEPSPIDTESLREALRYAVAQGVDIIVMSLQHWEDDGHSLLDTLLEVEEEFQATRDAGVLVVVAAGNQGRATVSSPADQPGVFVVGAMEGCGVPRHDSNRGADVDIWAFSTYYASRLGGDAHTVPGTSFAAPQIAGLAALLLQEDPTLTPADLEARILRDALEFPAGAMVNAFGMFARELPPPPGPLHYVGEAEVGDRFYLQFEGDPARFLHLRIPGAQFEDYCPHRSHLDDSGFVIFTKNLPSPLTIEARLHDGLQAGPWHAFTVERTAGVPPEDPKPWMVPPSDASNDAPGVLGPVVVGLLVAVALRRHG